MFVSASTSEADTTVEIERSTGWAKKAVCVMHREDAILPETGDTIITEAKGI